MTPHTVMQTIIVNIRLFPNVFVFLSVNFLYFRMHGSPQGGVISQRQGFVMSRKGLDSARAGGWIHHKCHKRPKSFFQVQQDVLDWNRMDKLPLISIQLVWMPFGVDVTLIYCMLFAPTWTIVNMHVFIYHYLLIPESEVTAEQALQMSEWLKNNIRPTAQFGQYMLKTATVDPSQWDKVNTSHSRRVPTSSRHSRHGELTPHRIRLTKSIIICSLDSFLCLCIFLPLDSSGFLEVKSWGCWEINWKLEPWVLGEDSTHGQEGEDGWPSHQHGFTLSRYAHISLVITFEQISGANCIKPIIVWMDTSLNIMDA